MSRLSTLIWLCVIVAATLLLYMVKYQVQDLQRQIARTTRELNEEREGLRVAAAEWAYLSRPERLSELAQKHLPVEGLTAERIAEIEAIPFPIRIQATQPDEEMRASPVSFKHAVGGGR